MKNILWIAPNLNHYKSRFLNRLVESKVFKITVVTGYQMKELGHKADEDNELYAKIIFPVKKINFHFNPIIYMVLLTLILNKKIDIVLMPLEKKHILLILYLFVLKLLFHFKLVSYNHPKIASRNVTFDLYEYYLNRFLFGLYDKVIFYTKQGRQWAIKNKLINPFKAFYANNTLDTKGIWRRYSFEVNASSIKTILFIGRLVPNKHIDSLFSYFFEINKLIPDLRLIIIGDGPMAPKIKAVTKNNRNIIWRGAVVDELKIAEDMRKSHVVFVPGHSGLSIVHAFCYGKPYITMASYKNHPPEIEYLDDGVNGLLLQGSLRVDCNRIADLILDEARYAEMCRAAYLSAQRLSIESWCNQMQKAFSY